MRIRIRSRMLCCFIVRPLPTRDHVPNLIHEHLNVSPRVSGQCHGWSIKVTGTNTYQHLPFHKAIGVTIFKLAVSDFVVFVQRR